MKDVIKLLNESINLIQVEAAKGTITHLEQALSEFNAIIEEYNIVLKQLIELRLFLERIIAEERKNPVSFVNYQDDKITEIKKAIRLSKRIKLEQIAAIKVI